ncbi:hypothetical protein [Acetobacter oeni]|uniref:Lysozyme inhibitor LprI N-terminal domain-containing protein n=1 Tax=Acetobacter oeni TaxID=304077 RepID=A0A511XIN4_9PROT|nr:hypothetical protein [Acetobacter oeni]MBB3881875.1 hypothetical protein [Acetobacter oeni]GBR03443.1 hypothetical protein AA21952_1055 [Acetobacter oeni LMG 21952]GEN62771.1 hypothetical protein AOE01nite_09950 [Acetobacter oeni]
MKVRLFSLFLIATCFSAPAMAEEELSAGHSTVPNAQLQKELAVLQTAPDQVSEACISALKELHETQGKLEAEQERTKDQDIAVAQDVLESDYENAIEMCGPDARHMCETHNPSDTLAHACEILGSLPD